MVVSVPSGKVLLCPANMRISNLLLSRAFITSAIDVTSTILGFAAPVKLLINSLSVSVSIFRYVYLPTSIKILTGVGKVYFGEFTLKGGITYVFIFIQT